MLVGPIKNGANKAHKGNDMSDFDWSNDNESIVVQEIKATAVFYNDTGNIVIRQEGSYPDHEDHFIVLPPEYAAQVAKVVLQLAEKPANC